MNKVSSYFIELNQTLAKVLNKESTLLSIFDAFKTKEFNLIEKYDYLETERKLEEFKGVLDKITSIIYSPHIKVSESEIILRSELSGHLSRESFFDTTKDTKLWKKKNNELTPEYVHTKENIDSIDCYENQFICLLINEINEEFNIIRDSLSFVNDSLEEHFEEKGITFNEYGIFNSLKEYAYPYRGIFIEPNASIDKIFHLINRLSRKLKNIMSTEFYKVCSKTTISYNVLPTNVLLHDGLYNYCYRYFKTNYLFKKDDNFTLETLFFNYFLLNMFNYMYEKGIGKGNKKITDYYHLDENGKLKIPYISFKKDLFAFKISDGSYKNGIEIEVKFVDKSGNLHTKVEEKQIAKYYLLTTYSLNEDNYKKLNPILLDLSKKYDNVIIITMNNEIHLYNNVLTLSLFKDNHITLFKNLFASLTMLFVSSKDQYKYKCPVCGAKSVYEVMNHYECEECNSKYSFINASGSDLLWIKSLRRKY